MKKNIILPIFILLISIFITACGSSPSSSNGSSEGTENKTVKIAVGDNEVTDTLVNHVKKQLKNEGVNLEIIYMSDWNIFNQALQNKEVDLNYFQHQAFLDNANKTNGWNLVSVARTFSYNSGFYSAKYKSLEEIPDKATIVIPSDPVNNGLSLYILDKKGVIKLKEGVEFNGSQRDIIENKHQYKFTEVDLLMAPNIFKDSDLIYLAGTQLKELGSDPNSALIKGSYIENYAMRLAARENKKDDETIQKVAKAFESAEVKKLVLDKYSDIVVWR